MKSVFQQQIRKLILRFAITIVILFVSIQLTTAPNHKPQKSELIKGMWITHVGNAFLTYTSLTDNVFHQLSRLNYNRVYVYAGSLRNQKSLAEIQRQITVVKKYGYGYAIFPWETSLGIVRWHNRQQKENYLQAI